MTDLISEEYRSALRLLHQGPRGFGNSGRKHAGEIVAVAAVLGIRSILDYGAGGGTLRQAMLSSLIYPMIRDFREYDPAIEGIEEPPLPADLVTCTDVLEHVEPEKLDAVLAHLRALTLKAAYLVISTQRSHKNLRDGRNAHLIVESPDWWLDKIRAAGFWLNSRFIRSNEDGIAEVTFWVV
jgi:2-polyprenyl-3-methyl-5-hydroxy-6-metoxy-1,4-benzoquinol methylase